MPIMTAQEVIERFTKMGKEEEVLITWWTRTDFPDADFEEGDEYMENVCVGHINDSMNDNEEWAETADFWRGASKDE